MWGLGAQLGVVGVLCVRRELCSARQDETGSISKQITKERTFLVGKLSVFNNSRKEAVENLSVWKLDCLEPAAAQLWLVLECFGAVGTEEK